jgi:phosphatidate cytidylyltransferase
MDSANAASAASQSNKSSLTQRVLSAAVLLPLVAVLVWWSPWTVAATVSVATVIGLVELYGAFAQGGYRPRMATGVAVAIGLILVIALRAVSSVDLTLPMITLAIIGSLIVELAYHDHEGALPAWSLTLAGAFYLAWLFGHFILLRSLETRLSPLPPLDRLNIESGAAWIYTVLAITWIQDTAAYFVGRGWGRHKMAPLLSPKKTWEGAAGGLLGSILAGVVCVLLLGLPISLGGGALLGLVGGIVGPLGDLAESLIKRQVGLKDAGNLIPGHGGILDRADSLLFTGPVLFYLIRLLTA